MAKRFDSGYLVNQPRAIATLIAVSVTLITFAFLSLVSGVPGSAYIVVAGISFSATFILCYAVLEFLVFKEINKIYEVLSKLKVSTEEEDFEEEHEEEEFSRNPIRRINQKISRYAVLKEGEIEKLKKLENYRKEFLADVSHELKTPIFAAQGYILTLLDGAMDDERVSKKFLKKAAKSLNGLDALVQELITLSHIESGVISMKPEPFDLGMLVQDVYDQLDGKAQKKNVVLFLDDKTQAGCVVNADYNRINQVLINLTINAIKYHKLEGGWVRITLETDGEFIQTEVADNGLGIPEEHLNRVFERFYRVDKSRSKNKGGSGLGLAIVKHILEGHQSTISIDSEPSVGTRFQFKLPKGTLHEASSL